MLGDIIVLVLLLAASLLVVTLSSGLLVLQSLVVLCNCLGSVVSYVFAAILSTLSSTFLNLAQGFSRDFTVTEYTAAWLSYQATLGLPQYGTRYTLGAITSTGIDVRLAIFNAHLIFNHQLSNNQKKRHGLEQFHNRPNQLPPMPPGVIRIGHDYEFPIGQYIPGDVRGPARVIIRFNVPAILIAIISHDCSRLPDACQSTMEHIFV